MSEIHDIIADIVDDRASSTTVPVTVSREGIGTTMLIAAEIESNIDPARVLTELGEDIREVVILHVTDDTQSGGIRLGDEAKFMLFGQMATHIIVKRSNNSASPQDDFWAVRKSGKDT